MPVSSHARAPLPRRVHLLLLGQGISQVGDKVYLLALATWVMTTTGSAARMGLVLAVATAAMVLCGLFSGALADRWNRKWILVGSDAFRGLVVLVVAAALQGHRLTLGMVLLSQALVAGAGALFNATLPALLPQMVAEAHLSRVNARKAFIYASAGILGPVLGGVLALRFGYAVTVYCNAASFLVAAAASACLPYRGAAGPGANLARTLREGYASVLGQRALLRFLGIVVVLHALVGSLQVLIPLLAGAVPGGYARNLGPFQSAAGVGSVVLALVLGVIRLRRREVPLLLASIGAVGLAYLGIGCVLARAGGAAGWYCLGALAAISGCIVIASTCFETYLQTHVENARAGSVFGIMNSVGASTVALSMVAFGVCVERFGLEAVVLGFGLGMVLGALLLRPGGPVEPASQSR